jgi:hypothetical protein
VRRALVAGVVALPFLTSTELAWGQVEDREAVVIVVDGATLPDLMAVSELRGLAASGGSALMNGRTDLRGTFPATFFPHRAVGRLPFTYLDLGTAPPARAAQAVTDQVVGVEGSVLVVVVSASPSAASAADGDELGAVIAAWGDPDDLLEADGEPKALTSDSTRRAGIVATVDPAATVAAWLDLPYDAGAPIEPVDEPAPLELYDRYLQQRRLAVPVAAASWVAIGVATIGVMLLLRARERVAGGTLLLAVAMVASFPWLALGLLLVGHVPSLTVWTVTPALVVIVAAGAAFATWATVRLGALRAIAVTGAAILGVLLVEALTGWWAAVTPLIGGGQLDGGRFFGMPNAMIGLVLGAALYAAHRLEPRTGAALLAVCALVAGSPWTGANFGAAITLFAASGLWLGVRTRRPWWLVGVFAAVTTATGMAVIAVLHRYLTERPTHVTNFLASGGGVWGAVERFVDRLGIGLDLVADSPLAVVPVLGTLVLLVVALRPPAPLAAAFQASDAWRDTTFVLLLGSLVAYVANDTGAAALGLGFVLALSATLHVSVAATRGMMGR